MSTGLIADDTTVKRMVRIRSTVMHMLRDRGYLVVEHELAMNRRDFERKYGESFHREDMLINKCKKNDPNDQVSPAQLSSSQSPLLSSSCSDILS
jgi:DNA-directed RNA polymerase I, II, and III subunit RPABC1